MVSGEPNGCRARPRLCAVRFVRKVGLGSRVRGTWGKPARNIFRHHIKTSSPPSWRALQGRSAARGRSRTRHTPRDAPAQRATRDATRAKHTRRSEYSNLTHAVRHQNIQGWPEPGVPLRTSSNTQCRKEHPWVHLLSRRPLSTLAASAALRRCRDDADSRLEGTCSRALEGGGLTQRIGVAAPVDLASHVVPGEGRA